MIEPSLNPVIDGLRQSATLSINQRSIALEKEGRKIYRFGLGQSPFPVPESVVQALREHAHEKDYLPVEGLMALREAVAEFHRAQEPLQINAENVLIGPGSKELMFLVQLCFKGEIILSSPCWVSYGPQARIAGKRVKRLMATSATKWRLDPQELDAYCTNEPKTPRLLILNYPGNPNGDTYSSEELEEIARIARKHRILVFSDEIYGLTHHSLCHQSIARFYPEGTMISSGLSKWCGAGGWRLGTLCFPKDLAWLQRAVAAAASETFTSVSAPIQYAAISAFQRNNEIDNFLFHQARILRALGSEVYRRLRRANVELQAPSGGFYVWMDFQNLSDSLQKRGILSSPELCERLLQDTGVAILPGSSFEREENELTARLSYVNFDGKQALLESQKIPKDHDLNLHFLENHCGPVLEGIDQLCQWLHS